MPAVGSSQVGDLHIPKTDEQGIFQGENGTGDQGSVIILSDGKAQVVGSQGGGVAVNHDDHEVYWLAVKDTPATELEPSAIQLEHTAQRRQEREPASHWKDEQGKFHADTEWAYQPGHEVQVNQRNGGKNNREYADVGLNFAGQNVHRIRRTDEQAVTVYDFAWQFEFIDNVTPAGTNRESTYPEGVKRSVTVQPTSDVPEPYRSLSYSLLDVQGRMFYIKVIQGYLSSEWFPGDHQPGRMLTTADIEVVKVHEREYDQNGAVTRSRLGVWYPIARLEQLWNTYNRPDFREKPEEGTDVLWSFVGIPSAPPPGTPDPPPPPDWWIKWYAPTAFITVTGSKTAATLRDTLLEKWPEAFQVPAAEPSFTAADGKVQVVGPRLLTLGKLSDADGNAVGTLNAYGHTFKGGSWAALRDAPKWDKDTKKWDYSPHIILHASADTVTAIRPDGKTEHCTVAEFEARVLRVLAGSFQGFNSVGSLSHSWPPEWAWANCKGDPDNPDPDKQVPADTRAICTHDPWRDSYKKNPPKDSPQEWTWRARPGKRPRQMPASAPRGLLGLTLADVTGPVLQDEALKKGEGPLRPPIQAMWGTTVLLEKVAKRLPYSPAEIPDERDDRTYVRNHVTVTFGKLPELPKGGA